MKIQYALSLILIAIAVAAGFYFYPQMPGQMASHWDINGNVNGYMSRAWALFLVPGLMIVLFGLFLLLPLIDPLKENIKKFRSTYDWFILVFTLFFFYVHGLTLAYNLGYAVDMGTSLMPAMGLLFIFLGFLLKNAKRNYFIGIRTPWTLSSDIVWDKTHQLGSKLFIIAGIITVLAVFLPSSAFYILFVAIIAASLVTVGYSYLVFSRLEKKK